MHVPITKAYYVYPQTYKKTSFYIYVYTLLPVYRVIHDIRPPCGAQPVNAETKVSIYN